MITSLDPNLFYNAKSSGMVKDLFRLTDKTKVLAFNVSNSGVFPAISIIEFMAIEVCFYDDKNDLSGVAVKSMSPNIYSGACRASTPWNLGNPGAVIFPENFQPWEADNESFLEEYKGLYTITYQGQIAFNNYLKEADRLLSVRAAIAA